jgi:hypothetical protein
MFTVGGLARRWPSLQIQERNYQMAAEAKCSVYTRAGVIKVKNTVAEVKTLLSENLNNPLALVELEQEYESEKYAKVTLRAGEIIGVGNIAIGNYIL